MRAQLTRFKHWTIALLLPACAALQLEAVQVGQSREDVIKELGAPSGKMESAGTEILRYPELTIRLKNGRVVALDTYTPPPRPSPSAAEPESLPKPIAPPHEPPALPATPPQYQPEKVELHLATRFVGTPSVETPKGWMTAGTAFLARRRNDSQIYILTVHHLFSPLGGLNGTISHAEMPSMIRAFQFIEWFGQPRTRPTDGCLVPEGDDPKGPLADLALFKVSNVPEEDAALLAETSPAVGELLWIVAKAKSGAPKGTILHKATVIPHNSRWLVCVFENSQVVLDGATGAPVLNAESRVVGIYSGPAEANGRKYAFIIPSALIQKTIREL